MKQREFVKQANKIKIEQNKTDPCCKPKYMLNTVVTSTYFFHDKSFNSDNVMMMRGKRFLALQSSFYTGR